MDSYRRPPEAPGLSRMPDVGRAIDTASAFFRQLIPLPGSEAVGPLSLPSLASDGGALNAADEAHALARQSAASIVSQAASILDEEMAKGVLAARNAGGTAPPANSSAGNPVLRQMHDLVENFATLWPQLQPGAAPGRAAHERPVGDAEPLAKLTPHGPVKPGERANISMTLRNSESRPVRLAPATTDLLCGRGGRIPSSSLELTPSEIALDPNQQKALVISATIPPDAAPGSYSGLLVVTGLDYLRALITIEVAGTADIAESQTISTPRPAVLSGTTSASSSSAAAVGTVYTPESTPYRRNDPVAASWTPMLPAHGRAPVGYDAMMQEAVKLARDGELGNSDVLRLLQMPHRPDEVKAVLARFDRQLTCEAKSKLILDSFVPLPAGVDNQRWEPIFDRYPVSNRTSTTSDGTVVLNEVQYYNGEMVQLHGGCTNVAAVREALAGSGYKPVTLIRADGQESAIVQFWAHQLTDTSLRPYNAMFLIVAAVPEHASHADSRIQADENGASSVLAMFDGRFDSATRTYENKTHLYFLRLLDSTRVAIDVGRERMGTDKRPGTIDVRREGQQRTFSIADGAGRGVARIRFVPADDSSPYVRELAKAAATAGIAFRDLPCGTEYVYPAVARIGTGPVSQWQWRTDVVARFQPVTPDTVVFDPSSEEGDTLVRWGFEPKVLGYIPNVRGVVTGIPEHPQSREGARPR